MGIIVIEILLRDEDDNKIKIVLIKVNRIIIRLTESIMIADIRIVNLILNIIMTSSEIKHIITINKDKELVNIIKMSMNIDGNIIFIKG